MATRKSTQLMESEIQQSQFEPISDEMFGIYAIEDYSERVWDKCYYALRNVQGYYLKRKMGDEFSWDALNAKFAEVFGSPTERKVSLEQLLDYAMRKFHKTQDDLVESNNRSWEMRREREAPENSSMRYSPQRSNGNGFKAQKVLPESFHSQFTSFSSNSEIDLDNIPY